MNSSSNGERKVFEKEVTEKHISIIVLAAIAMDIFILIFCIVNKAWGWIIFFAIILLIALMYVIIKNNSNCAFTLTIEDSTLTYDSITETIIFQIPCSVRAGKECIHISDGAFDTLLLCDNEKEKNKIMEFLKDAI